MSDLISRESLIEHLRQFAPEHYSAIVNDVITKEPVAFDKEKVMDEIKREYEHSAHWEVIQGICEIIEKGGIE